MDKMTRDVGQTCLVCAWRANCAKRFSVGADSTLYCPDFSLDLLIDKASNETMNDEESE
jgi:hypothetical protein